MNTGVGYREAARRVGVNYRTAKYWRAAQATPPPASAPQVISPRYLSEAERILIADRLRDNTSPRSIARELGRPVSTISRERHRNQQPGGVYQPHAAHATALARRARPKTGKIAADPVPRAVVQDGLEQRHSPQQIARRSRRDHPDRPEWHVTHETIYQALYLQAKGGLRREAATWLRTGRAMRRPQRTPDERRRPRMATDMVMISDRPAEVADRAVPGHWEGDLIIGQGNQSAIGTLVERSTRYVMLLHLPDGYGPTAVRDALIAKIRTLPDMLRRSLTCDQGSEMHFHGQFTTATDMPVCFCDPHSPWQRGTNENTNGLLRQYFPKATDLSVHTAEHLDTVATELNDRPRKTLDWDTPAERITTLLITNQQQCCDDP
ncbi:IS30 family transposase [Actinocrispum sp. NPDC049592]|uniref:IS30 family transposase n=1 Tax=Actinocrispum sp. NPDC049592 TaxID=3154835 RepID=UPI00342BAA15